MNNVVYSLIFLFFFVTASLKPDSVLATSLKSRYATISFTRQEVLRDFNEQISLGRKLSYFLRKKNIITLEDEICAKVDTIIEKAQTVLDMAPRNMHITIVLLPTSRDVSAVFRRKYGKNANHIAYYSLAEDTIYISVSDARLQVLAHEVGHAIVDHFFKVRPPYNIHELMAQFTEKHITD